MFDILQLYGWLFFFSYVKLLERLRYIEYKYVLGFHVSGEVEKKNVFVNV